MTDSLSPLCIVLPPKDAEVPLLRKDWRQCVERRKRLGDIDSVKYSEDLHTPLGVDLVWDGGKAPYHLHVSCRCETYDIDGLYSTSCRIVNLFSGEKYTWSITDSDDKKVESSFATASDIRLISFPFHGGPVNFRDIGGKKSIFGGRVKQNIVFRGSQLKWPSFFEENRKFLLEKLKIKTDLDLRYDCQVVDEMALGGVSLLGKAVNYIHYTVNAYNSFTPEQCELFRKTMQTFAVRDYYPIYLHCHGGADRTGLIAFLLNGLVGVEATELFDDYELSSLSPFPRSRELEYFQRWLKGIASYSSEKLPLHEQIEKYLLSIGVTLAEISLIRRNILE